MLCLLMGARGVGVDLLRYAAAAALLLTVFREAMLGAVFWSGTGSTLAALSL